MKWNSPLKTLLLAAMVATLPAAEAQTVHVAAANASCQFLTAALGADQLALTEITNNVANGTWTAGQKSTFHSIVCLCRVEVRKDRLPPERMR
jgi:hypothetical protein